MEILHFAVFGNVAPRLSSTSYALLGQLALRPWTTYELAAELRRNFHYFWPRAERAIYAESKRLASLGLTKAKREFVGQRPRTVYAITPSGREALREWLATPPATFSLEFEGLVRVFFAPFGPTGQLLKSLERTRADADSLLAVAAKVGEEYLEGRAPFQEQVDTRVFVFDFLTSYGLMIRQWTERTAAELARGASLTPQEKRRRALKLIERVMRDKLKPASTRGAKPQRAQTARSGASPA